MIRAGGRARGAAQAAHPERRDPVVVMRHGGALLLVAVVLRVEVRGPRSNLLQGPMRRRVVGAPRGEAQRLQVVAVGGRAGAAGGGAVGSAVRRRAAGARRVVHGGALLRRRQPLLLVAGLVQRQGVGGRAVQIALGRPRG